MRHSAAHVLAMAVLKHFPGTKLAIGPAIEEGFYYDFDFLNPISEADLPRIEQTMREIIKKDVKFIQKKIRRGEAEKILKDQPYKLELLRDIPDDPVSFYQSGDFTDLCKGPHVDSTGKIGAVKLLSVAGAYWRGSEKNKMLTRIYGTAFPLESGLSSYLKMLEEAGRRDHRRLGEVLGLWTFSKHVGAGLPLFTQKGTLVRRLINEFVEDLQTKQGIAQVWTPQIAKAELFKMSGHYDKYRENMFRVHSNYTEEEFYLKPMNCPQHTQIYASRPRSYRELPLRFADFAMLYRDEKPGELLGLIRTRSFSQDDCHIFCREDQVEEEMDKALEMTAKIMKTYGFSYKYRLSTRDPEHHENYLGAEATWRKAEALAEKILKKHDIEYFPGPGEAAFYAPKLDLIATDSLGREWQLSTLQIDYVTPSRFDLTYTDAKGREQRPVMLHRAIAGSPERLMAILLEHYGGALPVWLSPVQAVVIPVADRHLAYAKRTTEELKTEDIRVEIDESSNTVNKKIRNAELQKVPYALVVGDREQKSKSVAVRDRAGKVITQKLSAFAKKIAEEIQEKK